MQTIKLKLSQLYQVLNDKNAFQKCLILYEEIIKFNKKINLVSPSTIKIMESVHFLDSVLGSRLILNDSPALEFYDVGSGNGFPGLVLASLDSSRFVRLVESDQRKAEFIEHCAFKMQLSNVQVICKRAEHLALNSPAVFISRAFSSIAKSLIMYNKACPLGFSAYHFKSLRWQNEVSVSVNSPANTGNVPHGTFCSEGFLHKEIGSYLLPHNDQHFFIIKSALL